VALLHSWRADWDIAVAPLLDTPFNRHKSDLKFLEYSGLGLPGVYSDVEAYASVRTDVSGLCIANDVDAWCSALLRLASDAELRERLRTAAWMQVTAGRLLRQSSFDLLRALGDALEAAPAT
jgi:glycosyltransferase involved in cell wall biosynthesis